MSVRELIILGTASQVPSRWRNHNGYLLRWDGEGLLFDPGEGTQRQLLLAGVPSSVITRICLTHFHGDHCLGLPGIVQRLSLDRVPHPVHAYFPASGREFFDRLRRASAFVDLADIREEPIERDAAVAYSRPGSCTRGGWTILSSRSVIGWWSRTAAACCLGCWPGSALLVRRSASFSAPVC